MEYVKISYVRLVELLQKEATLTLLLASGIEKGSEYETTIATITDSDALAEIEESVQEEIFDFSGASRLIKIGN